jgi:hypothetical protein
MTQVRTGLFKYVRHDHVHTYMARGWFPVSDLGRTHGYWSVLMWHCDCGEVTP